MYKDKPYNYSASRKNTSWYQRRRTFAVAILGILGLGYWFGIFSSVGKIAPVGRSGAASWNWGSTPGGSKGDWDDRRQKVKEAFVLSWDGYEKHAWGMCALGDDLNSGLHEVLYQCSCHLLDQYTNM